MTTLDYQVGANGDDGYWDSGNFNNASNYFGQISGTPTHGFFRFQGVTIPAGSTITTAYLSWYVGMYWGTPPTCQIYAEDAANPTAPSSYSDANGRTKTAAYVSLPVMDFDWQNSPEIKTVIQELVDSYSYASGSAMQFLVICPVGSGDNYYALGYYDDYPDDAPKLHIEYTTSSGASWAGTWGG